MNICTYEMCNTYVCVLYHSSYMSSVIRMWMSSIWLSKNTPVDALKIHLTRSDTPLLRKTSIVFLPKCTDILIFFYWCVWSPNRLVWRGYSVSPQNIWERSPHEPKTVLQFTVGRSYRVHQGKRILRGSNTKIIRVTYSQGLLLLLCI